jgi:hypothetical protein
VVFLNPSQTRHRRETDPPLGHFIADSHLLSATRSALSKSPSWDGGHGVEHHRGGLPGHCPPCILEFHNVAVSSTPAPNTADLTVASPGESPLRPEG